MDHGVEVHTGARPTSTLYVSCCKRHEGVYGVDLCLLRKSDEKYPVRAVMHLMLRYTITLVTVRSTWNSSSITIILWYALGYYIDDGVRKTHQPRLVTHATVPMGRVSFRWEKASSRNIHRMAPMGVDSVPRRQLPRSASNKLRQRPQMEEREKYFSPMRTARLTVAGNR